MKYLNCLNIILAGGFTSQNCLDHPLVAGCRFRPRREFVLHLWQDEEIQMMAENDARLLLFHQNMNMDRGEEVPLTLIEF